MDKCLAGVDMLEAEIYIQKQNKPENYTELKGGGGCCPSMTHGCKTITV